mgnify:CR=1 FL=1
MKAIVTGQSGFIGGALTKRLIEMGWEVSEELNKDATDILEAIFFEDEDKYDEYDKFLLLIKNIYQ